MPRVRKDSEETHLAIVAAPDQAQQNIWQHKKREWRGMEIRNSIKVLNVSQKL